MKLQGKDKTAVKKMAANLPDLYREIDVWENTTVGQYKSDNPGWEKRVKDAKSELKKRKRNLDARNRRNSKKDDYKPEFFRITTAEQGEINFAKLMDQNPKKGMRQKISKTTDQLVNHRKKLTYIYEVANTKDEATKAMAAYVHSVNESANAIAMKQGKPLPVSNTTHLETDRNSKKIQKQDPANDQKSQKDPTAGSNEDPTASEPDQKPHKKSRRKTPALNPRKQGRKKNSKNTPAKS